MFGIKVDIECHSEGTDVKHSIVQIWRLSQSDRQCIRNRRRHVGLQVSRKLNTYWLTPRRTITGMMSMTAWKKMSPIDVIVCGLQCILSSYYKKLMLWNHCYVLITMYMVVVNQLDTVPTTPFVGWTYNDCPRQSNSIIVSKYY